VTIDIETMLHRVVAEVFDETFAVEDVRSSDASWLHGVHVSSRLHKDRTAIIRASYEWVDAFIPELNVQTTLFDYDAVEEEKETDLRRLCLVMRAYLLGEGRVEHRRRLLRRGTAPILKIEVDRLEWHLGAHLSSVPYP
jgi:hypothetical protein